MTKGLMCANQPGKQTMLILLALLLLSHGVSKINCSTLPINSTDLLSLQDFKHEINHDPAGALDSWNSSISHCMWKGVTCSLAHPGRVTMLDLAGHKLTGTISPSLGNLTFLRVLNLSANGLSGELPHFNRLRKLEVLKLSNNSLKGSIPYTITNCSNLRVLDLSRNSLVGEIPPDVGLLSNLSLLRFSWNDLTGIIPPTLGNITFLETLGLSYNHLTGRIPDGLGKLPYISSLLLGQNNISGGIPQDFFNMSSLEILSLQVNMLTGTLPPDLGDTLPYIQKFIIAGNMLEGLIPHSLGNASDLYWIDLSDNKFVGEVPSSLGKLSLLNTLNLEQNNLEAKDSQSWEFINALSNCRLLEMLSLYENQLQGVIPSSIGNLSTGLQQLYLGGNNLSGIIPSGIGNLTKLITLVLDHNSLSGRIEEWIGKLTRLQGLQLQANKFVGTLPSSIFDLTRLTWLFLSNNELEGPIPSSLGNLRGLLELDLGYNNFQGNIPLAISNLKQLVKLHLSSNNLSGEIPDVLGQCQNLETIEMDQNILIGVIPISMSKLQNLVLLNISHNNLSGSIPTDLDNLPLLSSLDLSYNHLQGKIPTSGIFENATAVSLDGNLGLCEGPMDLHLPKCSHVSERVERRNYLIKVLIPVFGFMSLILLAYFLFLEKKISRKTYLSSPFSGEHFLKVSYTDLAQATRDFSESNLIGRGSCGLVYKGKLKETKMEVAVKVFDLDMRGAEKSFLSECEALRSIQHRNLLPIITACSTVDSRGNVFKALVYEFMPNGSLDSWLHGHEDGKAPKRLGLTQIISIAVNIADALDYLHHDCGRPTIHCDLKPSNILLDDDMNALLGDFGIARFYHDSQLIPAGSTSSIGVKGTIGYIAPEYAGGGHASTSGDVYSFGIVLLEMITGKRPTDPMFKDGLDIVNFVGNNFPHQIFQVVEAHVTEECKDFEQAEMDSQTTVDQCLVSLLQVALCCARPLPSERMDMKQIASKLHATKAAYIGQKPKKPAH